MPALVLSVFPGIGLLDMAFELEGFCVVRGPDLLWGGDIHRFHPPAGVFEGVLGGPPCQAFSTLARLNAFQGKAPRFGNLIPEFERCVAGAAPVWFLMENVEDAPLPAVPGYVVRPLLLNNRWVGGEQQRVRRFCFGTADGRALDVSPEVVVFEPARSYRTVTEGNGFDAGHVYYERVRLQAVTSAHGGEGSRNKRNPLVRYTLSEAIRLQGLPEGFLASAPFTKSGALQAVANGVPLPMGRAIARAVKRAVGCIEDDIREVG